MFRGAQASRGTRLDARNDSPSILVHSHHGSNFRCRTLPFYFIFPLLNYAMSSMRTSANVTLQARERYATKIYVRVRERVCVLVS